MSAEVDLTDIRVVELPTIDLSGGVDLGLDLDNIRIIELPTIDLSGGLDIGLDNIRIRELAPINIGITDLPPINLNANLTTDNNLTSNSTVKTDNKVDLALDVRVRELPQLDVQLGLRPMRFHFPLNYRFCLTLFGIKIFEFQTCGESMVIAEDYKARKAESCE